MSTVRNKVWGDEAPLHPHLPPPGGRKPCEGAWTIQGPVCILKGMTGLSQWSRRLAVVLCVACLAGGAAGRGAAKDERAEVTWMLTADILKPMYEGLIADFERQNPDVHVRLVWVPASQYHIKLKTLIAARQAPDLIYCGDVWVAYLMPFLQDLTELVQRDRDEIDLDDFYPEVLAGCQHKGRFYYLPRFFNISLLYYNKTLFDEAWEPYPAASWTWEDYIAAGQRLTRRGDDGEVVTWGSDMMLGWWGEWLIFVRQAGGDMFDANISRCTLDSPEAALGMQFYLDKVYKHGISPKPGFGPANGFASNKMAMLWGGHTGAWVFYNEIEGLDWDIQILPQGPVTRCGGEIAMDAFGVYKDSKCPEAAWRVLKFISSKEGIRRHVKMGFLSTRKSVAEELLFAPDRKEHPANVKAVYEAMKYAKPIPRSPDYIEIATDVIQPEIDRMVHENSSVAEACRKATEAANRFMDVLGTREP